jgi:hypothetical protein
MVKKNGRIARSVYGTLSSAIAHVTCFYGICTAKFSKEFGKFRLAGVPNRVACKEASVWLIMRLPDAEANVADHCGTDPLSHFAQNLGLRYVLKLIVQGGLQHPQATILVSPMTIIRRTF